MGVRVAAAEGTTPPVEMITWVILGATVGPGREVYQVKAATAPSPRRKKIDNPKQEKNKKFGRRLGSGMAAGASTGVGRVTAMG